MSYTSKKWCFLSVVLILFLGACEPDDDDEISYRDEFLGVWDVNETTGWNAPQFYSVNISEGATETTILIEGLYNYPDTRVRGNVETFSVTIPQQSTDSINFSGSGQANADFDQITLNFTANDGTGADEVKAILSR